MRKIKINRAKWRTGGDSKNRTGSGRTRLINEDGYKCCLGFISCQVTRGKIDSIQGSFTPADAKLSIKYLTNVENSILYTTSLCDHAIIINDDINTSPRQKESLLKKLFKGIYEFEFFGEYTK